MSTALSSSNAPRHPLIVMAIAIVLPGMGQVVNGAPSRGLIMLFFILMLGVITYKVAAPGVSLVGQFAGGIFVYAVSVMDAYYWARYRAERYRVAP